MACDAACLHCGSAAGHPRAQELDTAEALALVRALGALGCESITLSGGEPLLRSDWAEIAAAIVGQGTSAEMVTNGLRVAEHANEIAAAGLRSVTVSIDGTGPVHDKLRGVPQGLRRVLQGAHALMARGLRVAANTQINTENLSELEAVHELLVTEGFQGWQLQLTMGHGRARTERSLCIEPGCLPDLARRICRLREESPLRIQVGDNIGYMGRCEPRLRTIEGRPRHYWTGCQAGLSVVGIRSDGGVVGCLSLPGEFVEANLRVRSLAEIWQDPRAFAYSRHFTTDQLMGWCSHCAFGELCRGGCRSLACSAGSGAFSNPYCLHRLERETASST